MSITLYTIYSYSVENAKILLLLLLLLHTARGKKHPAHHSRHGDNNTLPKH